MNPATKMPISTELNGIRGSEYIRFIRVGDVNYNIYKKRVTFALRNRNVPSFS